MEAAALVRTMPRGFVTTPLNAPRTTVRCALSSSAAAR
jgi:hypothetical protein